MSRTPSANTRQQATQISARLHLEDRGAVRMDSVIVIGAYVTLAALVAAIVLVVLT